jgi:hypothetical protein
VRDADIERGVLWRAVVTVARSERANRWIRAEQIEKAEWRGIHPAVGADGRHERNRSRRDEAGENGIGAVGKIFFEIQFDNSKSG